MSSITKSNQSQVVAVCCADLHLSHKPPVARSAEPDWYAAMARPLRQLDDIVKNHDVPLIVAGDVFHKYNPTPELINWAIDNLPTMYAVPGQHDLPYHNYDERSKSAYWTLAKIGPITSLLPGDDERIRGGVVLHGFPWGFPITERKRFAGDGDKLHVAVSHQYVWQANYGYPGSPEDAHVSKRVMELRGGYHAAVFGDNHKGFVFGMESIAVNCGCLIPRTIDEQDYAPSVWLLRGNGSFTRVPLDTSEDRWLDREPDDAEREEDEGLTKFLDELRGLDVERLDYREAIKRYLGDNEVVEATRCVLLDALEKGEA